MIVGIGTDIVSIERIAGVLERHGERFLKRVLTPPERARFERTKCESNRISTVPARIVVKETVADTRRL